METPNQYEGHNTDGFETDTDSAWDAFIEPGPNVVPDDEEDDELTHRPQ